MTTFVLKIIAMVTMLIDHVTCCFVPAGTVWYMLGRGVGRLAFPLFCFMIVEGFFHTRSTWKYMLRLAALALVSEIPFDMAFYGRFFYPEYQNVALTLLFGLAAITLLDLIRKKTYPMNMVAYTLLSFAVIFGFGFAGAILATDYGMFGVALIIIMYYLRHKKVWMAVGFVVLCFLAYGLNMYMEVAGVISFIFIFLYKGEKGPDDHKLFYLFYPLHLTVLGILVMYVLK